MKIVSTPSFIFNCILISSIFFNSNNASAGDPNRTNITKTTTSSTQPGFLQYYATPFTGESLWKSRPISPAFSDFVIPTSTYNPMIESGKFSSGCFYSDDKSSAVTVKPNIGMQGILDPDTQAYMPQINIPHWPANLSAASGTDGHADIFDVSTGVVHSFWRLIYKNGVWSADMYAWSPINGTGWGDPAHFHAGGRAAGVVACAGMIRTKEYQSTDPVYPHALAMSLAKNGAGKGFVFPATSADNYSASNTGQIPEGALVMLPQGFDITRIKTPDLKKIVKTLQMYGAYIVDTNDGTPFVIYAEIGSGLDLHKKGYNMQAVADLQLIRQSLRMVTSTKGWVDSSGNAYIPQKNLNVLSMRGKWDVKVGGKWITNDPSGGKFDTHKQALIFGRTATPIQQSIISSGSISQVSWAKPKAGETFKLTSSTTEGGKIRLILYTKDWRTLVDTYDLSNGQTSSFKWPAGDMWVKLIATSGVGASSMVSGKLLRAQ